MISRQRYNIIEENPTFSPEKKRRFVLLRSHFSNLQSPLVLLRNHFSKLKNRFVLLRSHFSKLKNRFVLLRGHFSKLKNRFVLLRGRFSKLKNGFVVVRNRFCVSVMFSPAFQRRDCRFQKPSRPPATFFPFSFLPFSSFFLSFASKYKCKHTENVIEQSYFNR